jgi:serum/glucocorticoid-regulated kinase 2
MGNEASKGEGGAAVGPGGRKVGKGASSRKLDDGTGVAPSTAGGGPATPGADATAAVADATGLDDAAAGGAGGGGGEEGDVEIRSSLSHTRMKGSAAEVPVTIDDFELLKVVGKGSFGKVMQVRNKHTGRIYAMKVLAKANIIRRNQVEHTRTERNVLGRINHPFIVGLNAAFQTADKLYFVLDYCAGGELFFHLGREGRFAEERTRFYAAQITLALEHLHNLGVIYRDLKPENVLLDHEGEPPPLPPQWAGRDGERDCAAQHG